MKDITNQEVIEHVKRTNPWWSGRRTELPRIAGLRPRPYIEPLYDLLTNLDARRAIVLLGPRRVGKTILIYHLIERLISRGVDPRRIGYLDVEHPILHYQSLDSLVAALDIGHPASAGKPRFVFLDEIQYLRDWERHLKPLVDNHPQLRILVSGSAAAALKRSSQESGAGRFTDFILPALTFPEYLHLLKQDSLLNVQGIGRYSISDPQRLNASFVDYLNHGGYPEVALIPQIREHGSRFIKADIIDKVLLRDLPNLYGIGDIQELNALFTTLAYNTAQEVSLEALSQRSSIKKPTIAKYIAYLEAAFLIRRVQRIDQTGKRFLRQRQFKVFLNNPTMRSALFGEVNTADAAFGSLVETAMFGQLSQTEQQIRYARWPGGEVDLVFLHRNLQPVMAIEIKWSNKPLSDARQTSSLARFCEKNGLSTALCTTIDQWGERRQNGITIQLVPAAVLAYHYGLTTLNIEGADLIHNLHGAGVPRQSAASGDTSRKST